MRAGNADLAAAAGAPVRPLVEAEPAVQGSGLPPYELDRPTFNTDYLFACDSDVVDATAAFTMAHDKFANHFDVAQMLDTRERRRITGEIELQPMDFFAHRRYRDTIVIARSNFDTHGFILHPMFLLKPAEHQPYSANVPFRALLPKNREGILVTGLGISAHRDCMPLVRMQPDVQNQGYAAGLAAATAAKEGKPLREISIRALQKQLIDCGILPPEILNEEDSFGGFGGERLPPGTRLGLPLPRAGYRKSPARLRTRPLPRNRGAARLPRGRLRRRRAGGGDRRRRMGRGVGLSRHGAVRQVGQSARRAHHGLRAHRRRRRCRAR